MNVFALLNEYQDETALVGIYSTEALALEALVKYVDKNGAWGYNYIVDG